MDSLLWDIVYFKKSSIMWHKQLNLDYNLRKIRDSQWKLVRLKSSYSSWSPAGRSRRPHGLLTGHFESPNTDPPPEQEVTSLINDIYSHFISYYVLLDYFVFKVHSKWETDLEHQPKTATERKDFWVSFLKQGFPFTAHIWAETRENQWYNRRKQKCEYMKQWGIQLIHFKVML